MYDKMRLYWSAKCILACGLALAGSLSHAEEMAQSPSGASASTPKPKIYKYVRSGVTTFSDIPPIKGAYIIFTPSCYACNLTSHINWQTTKLHLKAFADYISSAAHKYAVDPALVRAIIHAESNFNASARSRKGAIGLMQLMPGTAREVGVRDASVPAHNIEGGVQYLAGLLSQFRGNITLATAAYNAGPGAVEKYGGIPPYPETQVYVQRVKVLHERYKSESIQ
ncbi:MAG: lytic transglycosylase domain-containing protein [Burkholderiales bacterium]|nr:lytic transglycosylase domain-containing protein [Burkholderiales bacterium]